MICPTCHTDNVVENQALNKTFFYCRKCKEEVKENNPTNCSGHIFDDSGFCNYCSISVDDYVNDPLSWPWSTYSTFMTLENVTAQLPNFKLNRHYCEGGDKLNICGCAVCIQAYA